MLGLFHITFDYHTFENLIVISRYKTSLKEYYYNLKFEDTENFKDYPELISSFDRLYETEEDSTNIIEYSEFQDDHYVIKEIEEIYRWKGKTGEEILELIEKRGWQHLYNQNNSTSIKFWYEVKR